MKRKQLIKQLTSVVDAQDQLIQQQARIIQLQQTVSVSAPPSPLAPAESDQGVRTTVGASRVHLVREPGESIDAFADRFAKAIADDLRTHAALTAAELSIDLHHGGAIKSLASRLGIERGERESIVDYARRFARAILKAEVEELPTVPVHVVPSGNGDAGETTPEALSNGVPHNHGGP